MFEPNQPRKRALECLRLQADCMQLAGNTLGHKVQAHFLRMATVWSTLAVSEPNSNSGSILPEAKTLMT
jgi:hypothetical protein